MSRRVTSTQWFPSLSARTMSRGEITLGILHLRVQAKERRPRGRLRQHILRGRHAKPFVAENR